MKYDINHIYDSKNTIKVTTSQTGSKAMIHEKGEDKDRAGRQFLSAEPCFTGHGRGYAQAPAQSAGKNGVAH